MILSQFRKVLFTYIFIVYTSDQRKHSCVYYSKRSPNHPEQDTMIQYINWKYLRLSVCFLLNTSANGAYQLDLIQQG